MQSQVRYHSPSSAAFCAALQPYSEPGGPWLFDLRTSGVFDWGPCFLSAVPEAAAVHPGPCVFGTEAESQHICLCPLRRSDELLLASVLLTQADMDLRAEAATIVVASHASSDLEAAACCDVPLNASRELYRHTLSSGTASLLPFLREKGCLDAGRSPRLKGAATSTFVGASCDASRREALKTAGMCMCRILKFVLPS